MERYLCISTTCICLFLLVTAGSADTQSVNIKATIRDSVSGASIPQVRVIVQELSKSFNTSHSSFIIELPAGIYTFLLESPDYETMHRVFELVAKRNELVFDLVKISDREWLKKKADPFYMLFDSLAMALDGLDWPQALVFQNRIAEYTDPLPYNADSLAQKMQAVKAKVLDSLMAEARAAEDSHKLADAYYYYKKVVEYDSTNNIARQKVTELFVPKPEVKQPKAEVQQPPVSTVSDAEIETLFQQGVSKFISAEYDEAEKIFKRILATNPDHEMAKEYLRRTQARIKALKQ